MAGRRIPDYYKLLDVPRDAGTERLTYAFNVMAYIKRPDKNPGNADAGAEFQQVQEAFHTLSQPHLREHYDKCLQVSELTAELEDNTRELEQAKLRHQFLRRQLDELNESIKGLNAQLDDDKRQLALIEAEWNEVHTGGKYLLKRALSKVSKTRSQQLSAAQENIEQRSQSLREANARRAEEWHRKMHQMQNELVPEVQALERTISQYTMNIRIRSGIKQDLVQEVNRLETALVSTRASRAHEAARARFEASMAERQAQAQAQAQGETQGEASTSAQRSTSTS